MELIEALTSAGVNVQLKHDDTETSREKHGWVCIKTEDEKELVREEDVMHNRNYGQRTAKLQEMAETALAALVPAGVAASA